MSTVDQAKSYETGVSRWPSVFAVKTPFPELRSALRKAGAVKVGPVWTIEPGELPPDLLAVFEERAPSPTGEAPPAADPLRGPARREYPWHEWLNGRIHRITPDDYTGHAKDFRRYLHRGASKAGMLLTSYEFQGSITFAVYARGAATPLLPGRLVRTSVGFDDQHRGQGVFYVRDGSPSAPLPVDHSRFCTAPGCHSRLTPAAGTASTCRSALDPAWRCTDGPKPTVNRGA